MNWRDQAHCRDRTGTRPGHDPNAYFERPEDDPHAPRLNGTEVNQFRKECWTRCYVREQCLAEAMRLEAGAHSNRHGIWGGLTPRQRSELEVTNEAL